MGQTKPLLPRNLYDPPMSGWFWLIALGLFLVLIGLYLHWSVVLLGALLPFVPIVAELLRRRKKKGPDP